MWRPGPNGILTYPKRGKFPPPCPDGYEPRAGNPFVAELILEPCQYREKKPVVRRCCGGPSTYFYCHLFQKSVTRRICSECPHG